MANSFLQRFFGKKRRDSKPQSLSLSEVGKSLTRPGTPSSDEANQQNRKPLEFPNVDQSAETKKKLFAFVDLKDPFTPSEIAGEELSGPILSILSAKRFDSVFLFHTTQTRSQATATMSEIARRYRECRVRTLELPVSDPKNYASLMGSLWRYGQGLLRHSDTDEKYVCVSSGTAEMRAVWFLLTTLGIVKAKLLQVGTPIQPLFGKVNVKELRIDAAERQTIRDLALPAEAFDKRISGLPEASRPWERAPGSSQRSWLPRRRAEEPKDVKVHEIGKSGLEKFVEAFAERMRMQDGDGYTERYLPGMRSHLDLAYVLADSTETPLSDEGCGSPNRCALH